MILPTDLERKMYEYICEIQKRQIAAAKKFGSSGVAWHDSIANRQKLIDDFEDRYVNAVTWTEEWPGYHIARYKGMVIGAVVASHQTRRFAYQWLKVDGGMGIGVASSLDLAMTRVQADGRKFA